MARPVEQSDGRFAAAKELAERHAAPQLHLPLFNHEVSKERMHARVGCNGTAAGHSRLLVCSAAAHSGVTNGQA